MRTRAALVAAALALALATGARAEVVTLRDGDRITGKIASETARTLRLQTSYGLLRIPKSRIATIVRADGTEEVVNAPEAKAPVLVPAPEAKARLVLAITGTTFWQAWDPRDAPADPALRLEVRLDEEVVATYTDSRQDPKEIPGAVVNAFSFAADDVHVSATPPVEAAVPEVAPGRIVLRLDVPPRGGGERRLRLAYQANTGSAEEPAWRDVVESSATLSLRTESPALVQVRQDRGRMEYSGFPRRRMKNVDTFRVEVAPG